MCPTMYGLLHESLTESRKASRLRQRDRVHHLGQKYHVSVIVLSHCTEKTNHFKLHISKYNFMNKYDVMKPRP